MKKTKLGKFFLKLYVIFRSELSRLLWTPDIYVSYFITLNCFFFVPVGILGLKQSGLGLNHQADQGEWHSRF